MCQFKVGDKLGLKCVAFAGAYGDLIITKHHTDGSYDCYYEKKKGNPDYFYERQFLDPAHWGVVGRSKKKVFK